MHMNVKVSNVWFFIKHRSVWKILPAILNSRSTGAEEASIMRFYLASLLRVVKFSSVVAASKIWHYCPLQCNDNQSNLISHCLLIKLFWEPCDSPQRRTYWNGSWRFPEYHVKLVLQLLVIYARLLFRRSASFKLTGQLNNALNFPVVFPGM